MAGKAFIPDRGTLTAQVFANPSARVPPTLFYDITLPVRVMLPTPIGRPLFPYDEPTTEVQFEFIDLGRVEWRNLPDRKFRFPSGPDDEHPDGGIYLGGTHHSAFLTRLRFGERQGRSLTASLDIEFDLSLLRPLPAGLKPLFSVRWKVSLAVSASELDTVMSEARQLLDAPTKRRHSP
jgi:hypothetical protein